MMKPSVYVLLLSKLFVGMAELLIGLRIVLKLLGARTQSSFVRWVYETSRPLLQPFEGMFPSPSIEGGFVIEFSALFGLLVYSFLGYLVYELVATVERFGLKQEKNSQK